MSFYPQYMGDCAMAHYALIDNNSVVLQVIVWDGDDQEEVICASIGVMVKRTSYNTIGGVHKMGGVPYRKNYAGIGYSYNSTLDAFIPPKPYASWVLNEDTCLWEPPTPMPTDGKMYHWNESTESWEEDT